MSPAAPAVSVVLPTYDRADALPDAMRSVLEQSFTDLELVVVDDASTDDTAAVVDGVDDSRVRYVRHETNRGVSAARNTGIAEARGDVVAFQDSDDEWFPEKLRKQMAVFEDAPPDVGVVYTGMYRTENRADRYLPYPGVQQKEGDVQRSLLRRNFISTQMAAVRRECFDEIGGFDESLPALVDWELWIRIAERYRFRLVDEPLVRGGVNPDSLSSDRPKLVDARKRIVTKHAHRFDDDSLANHLFYVGHGSMKTGDVDTGRQYLGRAVRTNPRLPYLFAWLLAGSGAAVYNGTYETAKSLRRGVDAHV